MPFSYKTQTVIAIICLNVSIVSFILFLYHFITGFRLKPQAEEENGKLGNDDRIDKNAGSTSKAFSKHVFLFRLFICISVISAFIVLAIYFQFSLKTFINILCIATFLFSLAVGQLHGMLKMDLYHEASVESESNGYVVITKTAGPKSKEYLHQAFCFDLYIFLIAVSIIVFVVNNFSAQLTHLLLKG